MTLSKKISGFIPSFFFFSTFYGRVILVIDGFNQESSVKLESLVREFIFKIVWCLWCWVIEGKVCRSKSLSIVLMRIAALTQYRVSKSKMSVLNVTVSTFFKLKSNWKSFLMNNKKKMYVQILFHLNK